MVVYKCRMCGGNLIADPGGKAGVCDSCGTRQSLPENVRNQQADIDFSGEPLQEQQRLKEQARIELMKEKLLADQEKQRLENEARAAFWDAHAETALILRKQLKELKEVQAMGSAPHITNICEARIKQIEEILNLPREATATLSCEERASIDDASWEETILKLRKQAKADHAHKMIECNINDIAAQKRKKRFVLFTMVLFLTISLMCIILYLRTTIWIPDYKPTMSHGTICKLHISETFKIYKNKSEYSTYYYCICIDEDGNYLIFQIYDVGTSIHIASNESYEPPYTLIFELNHTNTSGNYISSVDEIITKTKNENPDVNFPDHMDVISFYVPENPAKLAYLSFALASGIIALGFFMALNLTNTKINQMRAAIAQYQADLAPASKKDAE